MGIRKERKLYISYKGTGIKVRSYLRRQGAILKERQRQYSKIGVGRIKSGI